MKHGDGFLFVFDLTNRETFESVRDHRDNVLRVKSDDPKLPMILVGNKSDLSAVRKVSYQEASSLAQSWNIPYLETSAKTQENVDKVFSEIFLKIKQIKAQRINNKFHQFSGPGVSNLGGIPYQTNLGGSSKNLTKEEEEALRQHSLKKRVKKHYKKFKKRCIIS